MHTLEECNLGPSVLTLQEVLSMPEIYEQGGQLFQMKFKPQDGVDKDKVVNIRLNEVVMDGIPKIIL